MDRSTVIDLVSEVYSQDGIGQQIPTEVHTTVFASVSSVTSSEYANAGQLGLRPELRFTVCAFEYGGEKIVEYNNEQYAVYRTYVVGEKLELYTERKCGVAK